MRERYSSVRQSPKKPKPEKVYALMEPEPPSPPQQHGRLTEEEMEAELCRLEQIYQQEENPKRRNELLGNVEQLRGQSVMGLKEAVMERKKAQMELKQAQMELKRERLRLSIVTGNYYAALYDVWKPTPSPKVEKKDEALFEVLRRTAVPTFTEQQPTSRWTTWEERVKSNSYWATLEQPPLSPTPEPNGYQLTKTALREPGGVPAVLGAVDQSRSSCDDMEDGENNVDVFFAKDIFGNPPFDFDTYVIRLVPLGPTHASMFTDVARCVLAIPDPEEEEEEEDKSEWWCCRCKSGKLNSGSITTGMLQKAIHGTVLPSALQAHMPPWSKTQKVDLATAIGGMKHLVTNQACFSSSSARRYLDLNPFLLIVLVMTLDEMKSWNGQRYDAIVLAGRYRPSEATEDDASLDSTGLDVPSGKEHEYDDYRIQRGLRKLSAEVYSYSGIHMARTRDDPGPMATQTQIETACCLLQAMVQGLFYSLLHRTAIVERDIGDKPQTLQLLRVLRSQFGDDGTILIPTANERDQTMTDDTADHAATSANDSTSRVRLVTLDSHIQSPPQSNSDVSANVGHAAPDPFLLTVKAAAHWSWQHEQQLLATMAEPPEPTSDDELDALAEQEFLERRQAAVQSQQDKELVGSSIQVPLDEKNLPHTQHKK